MITTDIDYPVELPLPQRAGYELQPVQSFIRTQLTSGRARQRPRFTSVPSYCRAAFAFSSNNEAALFEGWVKHKIKGGALWFNCRLKTPLGVESYVCRFTEQYQGMRPVGMCGWELIVELEIYEHPVIDAGWVEVPGFLLGASIFDVAMNKDWPEA